MLNSVYMYTMSSSRKYLYSPPQKGLEFPGGGGGVQGFSKTKKYTIHKLFEESHTLPISLGASHKARFIDF